MNQAPFLMHRVGVIMMWCFMWLPWCLCVPMMLSKYIENVILVMVSRMLHTYRHQDWHYIRYRVSGVGGRQCQIWSIQDTIPIPAYFHCASTHSKDWLLEVCLLCFTRINNHKQLMHCLKCPSGSQHQCTNIWPYHPWYPWIGSITWFLIVKE